MYTTTQPGAPPKGLRRNLLLIALFLAFTFLSPSTASGAVWYVSGDIGASGDGTTWSTAIKTIQEAIDAASRGDEIWVKTGTYLLSSQINLDKAVDIYGGFEGNETQRDERDWATNITTIDGQGAVYHCFHVTADTTIDGLVITGGNANGDSPDYRGGGLYIYQSSPRITNCNISQNTADYGGGIYNYTSSPTIANCTVTKNNAVKRGAGIYNTNNSSLTITNCTISENNAAYAGGIYNSDSSPTITNCTVTKNNAVNRGAGIYNFQSSPTITTCTISENNAAYAGGIYNSNSSPTITNCVISENTSDSNGGGIYNYTSSPTIANCTVTKNNAVNRGAGIYNFQSSPTITTCTFTDNTADCGGGIYNYTSSPTIANCVLWTNSAPDGPEICNHDSSSPTITYSDIEGGYEGEGNINSDPLFVDPENNDLHLQANSPCIDTGDNMALGIPTIDFEGEARIADGDNNGIATVDMGADEYTALVKADGDLAPLGNCDGIVNVGDALVCLRFALGLEVPTQEEIIHGDVAPLDFQGNPDPDGIITVGDALVILRRALGLVVF